MYKPEPEALSDIARGSHSWAKPGYSAPTWSWSTSSSPVIMMRFSILVSENPPFTVCTRRRHSTHLQPPRTGALPQPHTLQPTGFWGKKTNTRPCLQPLGHRTDSKIQKPRVIMLPLHVKEGSWRAPNKPVPGRYNCPPEEGQGQHHLRNSLVVSCISP